MKKNDSCEEMRILVGEYARGESACLDPEERARVEAHLPGCADCREHLASIREISAALASVREIEVPEDVAERSRKRLDAMLKEKGAEMKKRINVEGKKTHRPKIQIFANTVQRLGMKSIGIHNLGSLSSIDQKRSFRETYSALENRLHRWITLSIATCVILTIVVFARILTKSPIAKDNVVLKSIKEDSSLISNRLANDGIDLYDAKLAFFELTRNQQSPSKTAKEIQTIAETAMLLASQSESVEEVADARMLAVHCFEYLAEHQKANEQYILYAEALGNCAVIGNNLTEDGVRERRTAVTAEALLDKADSLYQTGEYFSALSFYDIIITRYSPSVNANKAYYRSAWCFMGLRQYHEAEKILDELMDNLDNTPLLFRAYTSLAFSLRKQKRDDEAIAVYLKAEKACLDHEQKANALYEAGNLAAMMGGRHLPEAILFYKRVSADYPDTLCAQMAADALRDLNEELTNDIIEGSEIL